MAARQLKTHLLRLLGGALAIGGLGFLLGAPLLVFTLGLMAYLAWLLFNIGRLFRWLHDASADPPDSLGLWRDVFDQIHALQKSSRKQRRKYRGVIEEFRNMTDAFPDAALVIDAHDNITWFNDAARQLLGLRVPEDMGQMVTNLLREPDFANWLAVSDRVHSSLEMASPLDSNTRLSVRTVRYRGDQRLLILRDITEVHNLEQVRRDFVANVSHELRTPLTVLLGYLESLQEECPDELEPVISRMQDQARQMQALLTDLLELSRLQSGQAEGAEQRVDIPSLLLQLREQAEELSQGSHQIQFDVQSGLCLKGSAIDLDSAFRNLINNAIHYTPAGGRIEVRWSETQGGAVLTVRDNGIGIPRRDIPRLTERFYRVGSDRSRHSGGTGLGLSIVKHVLNTHDARLDIESELGEGSEFRCRFPADRVLVDGQGGARAAG